MTAVSLIMRRHEKLRSALPASICNPFVDDTPTQASMKHLLELRTLGNSQLNEQALRYQGDTVIVTASGITLGTEKLTPMPMREEYVVNLKAAGEGKFAEICSCGTRPQCTPDAP